MTVMRNVVFRTKGGSDIFRIRTTIADQGMWYQNIWVFVHGTSRQVPVPFLGSHKYFNACVKKQMKKW